MIVEVTTFHNPDELQRRNQEAVLTLTREESGFALGAVNSFRTMTAYNGLDYGYEVAGRGQTLPYVEVDKLQETVQAQCVDIVVRGAARNESLDAQDSSTFEHVMKWAADTTVRATSINTFSAFPAIAMRAPEVLGSIDHCREIGYHIGNLLLNDRRGERVSTWSLNPYTGLDEIGVVPVTNEGEVVKAMVAVVRKGMFLPDMYDTDDARELAQSLLADNDSRLTLPRVSGAAMLEEALTAAKSD